MRKTENAAELSSNIRIRIYIEEDAYENFLDMVQKHGTSIGDYMRLRIFSSLTYDYVNLYKTEHTYIGKNVNKLTICIPVEVREVFKNLCSRFGYTQSDVIRGWVYQCLEMQKLFPKDL
jgi:hypothetical protein